VADNTGEMIDVLSDKILSATYNNCTPDLLYPTGYFLSFPSTGAPDSSLYCTAGVNPYFAAAKSKLPAAHPANCGPSHRNTSGDFGHSYRPPLGSHEYQFPIGSRVSITLNKAGQDWQFPAIGPDDDPDSFYHRLRTETFSYGIRLLPYDQLDTPGRGVLEFTCDTSMNYAQGKEATSRFLYDVLWHGRDNMFIPSYHVAESLLKRRQTTSDGLAVLQGLLENGPEGYKAAISQTSVTDLFDLPKLHNAILTDYLISMSKYMKGVGSTQTPLQILRLVQEQLLGDSHFDRACQDIQKVIDSCLATKKNVVPQAHLLRNLESKILTFYAQLE